MCIDKIRIQQLMPNISKTYSDIIFVIIASLILSTRGVSQSIAIVNTDTIDTVLPSIQLTQTYTKPSWKDPFVNMPGTWKGWYEREFTTDKIPYYTIIALATAALIVTDRETYDPVRKLHNENYNFRKFSEYSEFMGQGWFQFGIAGAFAIHGLSTDNNKSLVTASQTVEVILTCGAVIQIIKHITGRETPILSSTPTGIWRFFPNQIEYHKRIPMYDAFPTGHLATATATLTVIMDNYPDHEWIPYVGYPAIGFIGIAMVGQGIHWWSDYPLGIAIGYSFAKVVTGRYSNSQENLTTPLFQPNINLVLLQNTTPGISLGWRL